MTHHFSEREKNQKKNLGPFDQIGPQIWAKKGHFGSKVSKIFDLNDSESKKGQKNHEKIFSLLNWSDTYSFLAKKNENLNFIEFLSLFVSVRLCIFFWSQVL